jgi:GNAT superfamily N-acetyltransferase
LISRVTRDAIDDVLPVVQAYLDFYAVKPADTDVRALCEALAADPVNEGVQLLARDASGIAVGFATIFWSWSTTEAARIGIMNDLFVSEQARGSGVADALIEACRAECRERGAASLQWQTAKDNLRAQAVYERVGGQRSEWLDYSLSV